MGDRVVYQKAFGVANVETNAPMETQMLFRLGSNDQDVYRCGARLAGRTRQDQTRRTDWQPRQRT